MPDYAKKFIVRPGTKVRLKDEDPDFHGKHESPEKALVKLQAHVRKISELQYLMYAENKHSVLILLQGLDGAGKDGVIRHVLSCLNPQGCTTRAFKQPTAAELAHDFLWRVHAHAPAKGSVGIFNRSHYEDVLVVRVHQLVPEEKWSRRFELINDFEKLLAVDNETTILKFFLHISREEQLLRFKKRLEDPARNWKVNDGDYVEREYWDDYMDAYEDVLRKTSTKRAPWFIIPSNHKWFRDLAISQIIVKAMEDLKMKAPKVTVNLDEIRRKYHAEELEERASKRKTTA